MKQHAALPPESIQLLFTHKYRDLLRSLYSIYSDSSVFVCVCEYASQTESLSEHKTFTVVPHHQRACVMVCVRIMLHLQQKFERVIVFDPALAAGHGRQVGEPNAGDPVFVVRRVETLELLPFLS